MKVALAACLASCLIWAAGGASAADLSDPVPGHPDLAYEDIVRLVTPDVTRSAERYAGTLPDNVRAFFALVPTALKPGRGEFDPPDAVEIVADGKKRVLLLMNFALRTEYDQTFAALSLIGFDGGPKLIDIVNVSAGMNVFFQDPKVMDVGPGETAALVQSQMQSGQAIYNNFALALVRNDTIERIAELWTDSRMNCAGMEFVSPAFSVVEGDKRYRDIGIVMTEEQDGGATAEDCGEDPIPEPFRRETTVTYVWNEELLLYRPDSSAFERFSK